MSSESSSVRILPTEAYFTLVKRQLSEHGQAYVRVTGMSMWPLLRHLRDGVIIVPPGRVRAGDIVLFDRRNGRYALHRVIRVTGNSFSMAGDNQRHMETGLPLEQVVGVVTEIDRGGRRISCRNFFLEIYSRALTSLAWPRIYLRKAVGKLIGPLRRSCRPPGKGA